MEMLLNQLRQLPDRLGAMGAGMRTLLVGGLAVVVASAVAVGVGRGESYQYAFTNLTPEDSAEAVGVLKAAGIPHRLEAGGGALAVPANKTHDARLLLAGAGLPRGGGVGFELFDRGELGVSEFTQKVNLRRAIEGELSRTLSRLAEVRSARVHLSLPERTLFQKDDRRASAAVVLNLQPGRVLGERELAGIRHLVASAVAGLPVDEVTVMDGRGSVLTASGTDAVSDAWARRLERELEGRILGILEPIAGPGAVVAKVTATVDASEVRKDAEVFDPDMVALRSERRGATAQSQDSGGPAGVAGAAANQPLQPAAVAQGSSSRGSANTQEETKNWEVSRTTTTTLTRSPRLVRLSAAVLLDAADGTPRTESELSRLAELARRAIGFDEARGDLLEISSSTFGRAQDAAPPPDTPVTPEAPWFLQKDIWAMAGGGLLLVILLFAFALRRRPARQPDGAPQPKLQPGARVGDLEAKVVDVTNAGSASHPFGAPAALADPMADLRGKAQALVQRDPARAALLLGAWLESAEPAQVKEEAHG